jgi:alpha-glucosidase
MNVPPPAMMPTPLDAPHHDGSPLYVEPRAPELGSSVRLRLRVPAASSAESVHVRSVVDGEPEYVAARVERHDGVESWWVADLRVLNPVLPYRFLLIGGDVGYCWVNSVGVFAHDVPDRDDFRVTTHDPAPQWLAGTVVYEIMPDRFARGPHSRATVGGDRIDGADGWAVPARWDDPIPADWREAVVQIYGGDLEGVTSHLDHLERLGVNAIYLTPFFPAPSAHRYNASTFRHVDPLLGGDGALAALTAEAHRRGIRVVGDLTTNHSGSAHEWFEAAIADASAPEAAFYFFESHPDDYVKWFGVATLPKFDLSSSELRRRLVAGEESVVARWLRPPFELDGWRIDVANMTGRQGALDVNREVARDIRATMAAMGGERWLVAEHCHDATADLVGDGWHGTMAYTWFTRPVWCWLRGDATDVGMLGFPAPPPQLGGAEVVAAMRELAGGVSWAAFTSSMTLLDSHDTARFASVVCDLDRHVVGVALLMTYPGVPMVFAGDEAGVEGTTSDQARRAFPWDDAARHDGELARAFRRLIEIRRTSDALQRGGLRWAHVGADSIAFLRESPSESVLVFVARAPHPRVTLSATQLRLDAAAAEVLFGDELHTEGDTVQLPSAAAGAHIWRIATASRGRDSS